MNSYRQLLRLLAAVGLAVLASRVAAADASTADSDAVQNEVSIEGQMHKAAGSDDLVSIGSLMESASKIKGGEPASVVIARRAAMVCGWLQNENQYGKAAKLAALAVKRIANEKEPDTKSHIERLYWEALLIGRYQDLKAKALPLLVEAAKLAPDDDRVGSLEEDYANALASFGH